MDVDVVPGSVTDWTVTLDDQRRLKRALARIRVASPGYWIAVVAAPVIIAGIALLVWPVPSVDVPSGIELKVAAAMAVATLVLVVAGGAQATRRRVECDFPVGATFTSWATKSGLGVRTPSRLIFYPWSRLAQVDQGTVLVRCHRQVDRWAPAVPTSLLPGPEEPSRSVDFPVQLFGPGIVRELAMGSSRDAAEEAPSEGRVQIDRALHRRLGWTLVRQQMGVLLWVLPACVVLQVTTNLIDGSYRLVIVWLLILVLNAGGLLRGGEGQISRMYPVGATVVGSVGESVVIQGPWGSVAWHRGWLRQGRVTEYTVAYEVLRNRPRRGMASLDKRILVVPRAFLDTPAPAVSAEV